MDVMEKWTFMLHPSKAVFWLSAILPTVLADIDCEYSFYSASGKIKTEKFECRQWDYCCGQTCCRSSDHFFRLWYFWLVIVLVLLMCVASGYYCRRRMLLNRQRTTVMVDPPGIVTYHVGDPHPHFYPHQPPGAYPTYTGPGGVSFVPVPMADGKNWYPGMPAGQQTQHPPPPPSYGELYK